MHKLKLPAIAALSLALAACAVGPDFVKPTVSTPERFAQTEAGAETSVAAPDAEFWRGFNDPLLTRLVDEALSANHDLRIALARYDRSNALLRGAKFDYLPTITASGEAADTRASADQAPGVARADRDGESYSAGINASWELDLFGRVRRGVEAQRADTAASAATSRNLSNPDISC